MPAGPRPGRNQQAKARAVAQQIARRHGLAKGVLPALVEAYESGRRDTLRARYSTTTSRSERSVGRKPFGYYEDEAPVVAMILGMRDRELSLAEIAADLNKRGLRRRDRGEWTRYSVRSVIESHRGG